MIKRNRVVVLMICLIMLALTAFAVDLNITVKAEIDETAPIESTEELEDVSVPVEDQVVIIYKNQDENNIAELELTGEEISEATSLSDSVDVVTPAEGQDQQELIENIREQNNVESVCPNIEFKCDSADDLPNDPKLSAYPDYYLDLQIDETWDITNSKAETIEVAVLDTGLSTTAEDFNDRVVDVINVTGTNSTNQTAIHGTNVASNIVAAANNGIGLAGASGLSDVKVLAYRVESTVKAGNISFAYLATAMKDIYNNRPNVKVINMSFGLAITLEQRNSTEYKSTIDSLQKNINELYQDKGIIFVASAGNSSSNLYNYPASCENVICVSSVDANEKFSSFSTYNDTVDIAATGNNVPVANKDGTYGTNSGTSFSSPIVAGSCAFLLSATGKSRDEVIDAILSTADLTGYSGKNVYTGNGILQLKDAFEYLAGESDFTVSAEQRDTYYRGDSIILTAKSEGNLTYEFKCGDTVKTSDSGVVSWEITEAGTQTIKVTGMTECGAAQTEELTITAEERQEAAIELSVTELTLVKGNVVLLTAEVFPADAGVTWTSADPDVATVDQKGSVTGISAGSTVITCMADDDSHVYASCNVTVKDYLKGDVDLDGKVEMDDARLAKAAAEKMPEAALSGNQFSAADLDGNGKVTINEAHQIKRAVLTGISLE